MTFFCIVIISATVHRWLLKKENARRDRGERDEVIVGVNDEREDLLGNGVFNSLDEAKREKGDEWSGYRYVL
jgi:hypothetical protein